RPCRSPDPEVTNKYAYSAEILRSLARSEPSPAATCQKRLVPNRPNRTKMPRGNRAAHRAMKRNNKTKGTATKQGGPVYKRIVLKLSGESLQGPLDSGIHAETIQSMAREVKAIRELGVQVA